MAQLAIHYVPDKYVVPLQDEHYVGKEPVHVQHYVSQGIHLKEVVSPSMFYYNFLINLNI